MSKRFIFLMIRIVFSVILLLFLFFSNSLDFSMFSSVNLWVFVATSPLYLLAFLTGIYRWWLLVEAANLPLSFWDTLRLSMSGVWVSSVVPGGSIFAGDAARTAIFAAENKKDRIKALVSIFLDRLLGLIAIFIITILALFFNFSILMKNSWLQLIAIICVSVILILFAVIILAFSDISHQSLNSSRLLKKIPGHKLFFKVLDSFYLYRNHKKALLKAHLISYIGHGFMIFAVFLLSRGVDIQLHNLYEYLFAISVGIITAMIPISGPAGIGAGNLGYSLSFALVNSAHGAELALLWQVTFILTSQIGLPFFLIGRKRLSSSSSVLSVP